MEFSASGCSVKTVDIVWELFPDMSRYQFVCYYDRLNIFAARVAQNTLGHFKPWWKQPGGPNGRGLPAQESP